MERLINFIQKRIPQVDPSALCFLEDVASLRYERKNTIIKLTHQHLPNFHIVLDGLVGGFDFYDEDIFNGQQSNNSKHKNSVPILRDLICPMDYFTGSLHTFTKRNRAIEYRSLTPVALLRMSIEQAVHGQKYYPDLSELFQIMKQRKINLLRHQVTVYQEKDYYRRYCLYRKLLPEWNIELSHQIQHQFLQMSIAQYNRVKAQYLRNF